MPVYVINNMTVHDKGEYKKYLSAFMPVFERHGGKILAAQNAPTAIEGASIALISRSKRRALEALVSTVEHCRLESHPRFFDYFVEGCQFKPLEFTGRVAG